jgi:quinol-cytochrome oxidoreductase complex cytochrome b subunit
MTGKQSSLIRDPKYDPPYPQDFHGFWPRHALKTMAVSILTIALVVGLSYFYRVPSDINMPPLPTEGEYLPAPEWYLIFIFQPFWYLTGKAAEWLPLGTFWAPVAILLAGFALPLVFGRKKASGGRQLSPGIKLLMGAGALAIWVGMTASVVGNGYPAKTTGCTSCHNPMMGVRQALPPADMAKYYRGSRQLQISVGGYRAGSRGAAESYKDANWQLRHYYEPTMTW